MKLVLAAAIPVACAITAPAFAQEQPASVVLGVTGGTLGIGPEVAVRVSPVLGLRANAGFFGVGHSVDSNDIEYDGDLKLSSVGAMIDVHPFANGFRVSGGLRHNRNKVKLNATPSAAQVIRVGGDTYTGAQIGELSGTVRVKKFAPSLTLGYGGGLTRGIKFGIDAGVLFQGSPRIRNLRASGPFASLPVVQESLAREEREIEDDIGKYDIYPIVQLSLGYAF